MSCIRRTPIHTHDARPRRGESDARPAGEADPETSLASLLRHAAGLRASLRTLAAVDTANASVARAEAAEALTAITLRLARLARSST